MYRGRTDDDAHLEANSWCCVPCVLERVHFNGSSPNAPIRFWIT